MSQESEMIEKLSAENRKLVWQLEAVRFELKAYKARFGMLNAAQAKPTKKKGK